LRIYVLHDSVATQLRCSRIFNKRVRPLRGLPLWGRPCSRYGVASAR